MTRLTKRCNGVVTYIGLSNKYETGQIACEVDPQGVRELLERVAAYEDTTVTPLMCAEYKKFEDEAISKGVTIKRIIELMDADAEGRVVVLAEASKSMTAERAVEILDPEHREHYESIEPVNEACRMGMAALKKQIPAAPVLSGDGYADGELVYDTWECPNCGKLYEIYSEKHDHCPSCGQAIAWEGLDESL